MAISKIERVLRHDGIVAVFDQTAEQARAGEMTWLGDERWRPVVAQAARLRSIAGEPSVRVLVGEHAVLVSGDDRHVVGVVFIKGHPVVKSVVRMVRQLLRQPSNTPKPSTAAAPSSMPPQSGAPAVPPSGGAPTSRTVPSAGPQTVPPGTDPSGTRSI